MIEHALVNTCFPKSKFQDLIAQDIQFLGTSSESSIAETCITQRQSDPLF